MPHDGQTPTLLYGYGGFEISMRSSYRPITGISWLEKGGVYVVANIRGGGEFGPRWHQSALKEHRQRAYDDFIAVAEDLIRRKVTSPNHLGIRGGSNGGLLMGNAGAKTRFVWSHYLPGPLLDAPLSQASGRGFLDGRIWQPRSSGRVEICGLFALPPVRADQSYPPV